MKYENLQIKLPFEVLQIHSISFDAKLNKHSLCCIEALIEEDKAEEYFRQDNYGKSMKVSTPDEVIFAGKCRKLRILYRDHSAILEVQAVSYTYELDIREHSRVFMDTGMTYKELIQSVLQPYGRAECVNTPQKEAKLEQVIVQYKETDWEFLKRIGSHFGRVLVADSKEKAIRFYFGLPDKNIPIESQNTVKKSIADFYAFRNRKSLSNEKTNQNHFLRWSVESKQYIPLGMQLIFEGKKAAVTKIHMKSKQGEVIYNYSLQIVSGIKKSYQSNSKIKGVSLEAIVKKVHKNSMQVHFCMGDAYDDKEGNAWFPYVRETGDFYYMPASESKVHIYFPTEHEEMAYVTHCLHTADKAAPNYNRIAEPANKSLSTKEGQALLLTKDAITVSGNQENQVQLTLGKNGTVSVKGKTITLQSTQTFHLGNPKPYHVVSNKGKVKSIEISAKKEIILSSGAGQMIELRDEAHMYGIVRINE
ncbi:hypothetical protein acsn021_08020 [Anaerocolumna cellulosilytica]|uniref:Uncharacterized protein n=1 Tax=Anaerocolumna cellulosilytica TaxID=433286 RepID=A0A6S6QPD3_9FIRM|nr:hypothetical protein [Anaerocolumna cellulosilytica]MBB5197660.1 hypothetical protein [Anaerocolumna cellulosilytica]BCJ93233.1 hypothetical protein acsn021_08020 [Anaerocolumna cellulosilytica]